MQYIIHIMMALGVGLVFIFLGATTEARNKAPNCATSAGLASFYAGNFIGRKTASGAVFTSRDLTAAHKTLPFGTRLKLTIDKRININAF